MAWTCPIDKPNSERAHETLVNKDPRIAAPAALGMCPQWPDILSTDGSYWMEYLGDDSMPS